MIEKMVEGGLAPQTIVNYTALVKLALGAATDENGECLYPRTWNSTFLDMPIVKDQRQPSFLPEKVSSIVSKASGQTRVILALLAGSGLRMGELVGLEVKHVSPDCRILSIEQSIWNQDVQSPKSRNAYRRVDLCTDVAVMLGQHLGSRWGGYVFQARNGSPIHQSNLLSRELHSILGELGIRKCGFHALRRFRATHLRKSKTPESLIRFWLGHSITSITDLYDKSYLDDSYRQAEAERIGIGFSVG